MKTQLSNTLRRDLKRLISKGYHFKPTSEGISWWLQDGDTWLVTGCVESLELAVQRAKRHDNQVALKKRLEIARIASYLLHQQRRQITQRLPA